MTTPKTPEKTPEDIIEEVRRRMRQSRPEKVQALLRDLEEPDLPEPTHYSNQVH